MEELKQVEHKSYWWRGDGQTKMVCAVASHPGDRCPECQTAVLVYDGLFILSCPACGYIAESGAFT